MDSDKYPTESDRRRFVKGVAGGATMAALSTAAGAAIESTTTGVGTGGGTVTYRAAKNTDG